MVINGVGAAATGVTVLVVLAAKFIEGAWVVAVLAALLITLMTAIHRHYRNVAREIAPAACFVTNLLKPPLVLLPVDGWTAVSQKALRFALTLSGEVEIVHVQHEAAEPLDKSCREQVEEQARAAGRPAPTLTVLRSPYRFVVQPILDHVLARESEQRDRTVAVVITELVERHWYDYFLHNQRGELLTALLLVKGSRRIAIINVPWYLEA
jgi:hypothetical protein